MADCTDVPTLASVQESKKNMDTITEFVESSALTLEDQYGGTRLTLEGVIDRDITLNEVNNDVEIKALEPKAYVQMSGYGSGIPLVGIVLSTETTNGNVTLLVEEIVTSILYSYTTGDSAVGYNGTLSRLTNEKASSIFGGYSLALLDSGTTSNVVLDASLYNTLVAIPGGAGGLNISNVPAAGVEYTLSIRVYPDGIFDLPSGILWAKGDTPDLTISKLFHIYLTTIDGGTSWLGAYNTDFA